MQAEEIFRSANDQIAQMALEHGWRFPVPFLCECSDQGCFARIEIALEEYEEIRSHPQRYLTLPGHEVEGASLFEHDKRFSFAEKHYARH